jgi:hypothetical protein
MAERDRPPWLTTDNLEALKEKTGASWAHLGVMIGADYDTIYRLRTGKVWVPHRSTQKKLLYQLRRYGIVGDPDPPTVMRPEDL